MKKIDAKNYEYKDLFTVTVYQINRTCIMSVVIRKADIF